jgi:hypothetical protein
MTSEPRKPHPADRILMHRLERMQRLIAGGVAVGAGAAGTLAVFMNKSQAGSVALLALGALFGLLALTGHSPVSVKVGEYQVLLYEVLAEQMEESSPAVAEQLAEAVQEVEDRLRTQLPPPVDLALDYKRYEEAIFAALDRILPKGSWSQTEPGQAGDAVITIDGKRVFIEVKVSYRSTRFTAHSIRNFLFPLRMLDTIAKKAGLQDSQVAMLLVTNIPLAPSAERELVSLGQGRARYVQWKGQGDDQVLREAVNQLVGS